MTYGMMLIGNMRCGQINILVTHGRGLADRALDDPMYANSCRARWHRLVA